MYGRDCVDIDKHSWAQQGENRPQTFAQETWVWYRLTCSHINIYQVYLRVSDSLSEPAVQTARWAITVQMLKDWLKMTLLRQPTTSPKDFPNNLTTPILRLHYTTSPGEKRAAETPSARTPGINSKCMSFLGQHAHPPSLKNCRISDNKNNHHHHHRFWHTVLLDFKRPCGDPVLCKWLPLTQSPGDN